MFTFACLFIHFFIGIYWMIYACFMSYHALFTPRVLNKTLDVMADLFLEGEEGSDPWDHPLRGYLLLGIVLFVAALAVYALAWPIVILAELFWVRYNSSQARHPRLRKKPT